MLTLYRELHRGLAVRLVTGWCTFAGFIAEVDITYPTIDQGGNVTCLRRGITVGSDSVGLRIDEVLNNLFSFGPVQPNNKIVGMFVAVMKKWF